MPTFGVIKTCSIVTLFIVLTLYIILLFFFSSSFTYCERDILEAFILMLGFTITKICILDSLFSTLLVTLTEGLILFSILEINETYGCSLERYSEFVSFSWTLIITIMWIDSIFVSICTLVILISNCWNGLKESRQLQQNPYEVANRYGMTGNDRKRLLENKVKYSDDMGEDCSICLIGFTQGDEILKLPSCDHLFHVNCLNNWVSKHSTCPYCRTAIGIEMQENLST